MLFAIRALGILILAVICFFVFRYLVRSGKAKRAFNLEEKERTIASIKEDEAILNRDLAARRERLAKQQKEIAEELKDNAS